jgi:2-oxoglutarate ferredoxin oxidoreductase subunit gamma
MGYVLSNGAMLKDLNVTYFPSYGAEMRGGTANCTVTVSDKPIASPVASRPDNFVAMNPPSLERFEASVAQGGLVVVNSSLIKGAKVRDDLKLVEVPTVELALEAGSDRTANMVMIGALAAATGLLNEEETAKGMEASLKGKEKFFALNRKGIARGFSFIKNGK